jgi:hypothetical protein
MKIYWKEFGKKRSWPNFRYYSGICLEELRKPTKTSIGVAGHQCRDFKPGPPEYEGVLTT